MNTIIYTIIVAAIIAILLGILLGLFKKIFHVDTDPKVQLVRDALNTQPITRLISTILLNTSVFCSTTSKPFSVFHENKTCLRSS